MGEAEISSERRNDGKSNMAATGTSLNSHQVKADTIADHLPRRNRSDCSPTYCVVLIPIPINESSSILLPTYPIRMSPLMHRLISSYPRYIL